MIFNLQERINATIQQITVVGKATQKSLIVTLERSPNNQTNNGTGNGSVSDRPIDFTDVTTAIQTATDTIKSESGSIQSKIEAINPSDALNSIQTVLNNIQASVDGFANKDGVDSKQQKIDVMKQNLLEFAKIQKDTNNQITKRTYQDQELSGHIFSNGKIKVNKGESGGVPWERIYERKVEDLLSLS